MKDEQPSVSIAASSKWLMPIKKCRICYTFYMTNLTLQAVKELFPRANTRHYDRNQIICYDGDKPQHIFFIIKGHIRYYDIDERGNDNILHINGPKNIFPMLYAFDVADQVNGFYAAIDKVEVLSVALDDFHKVMRTNIDFSNTLVRWFLGEIEQLAYRINSFEKTDARIKIMYALKYLATHYGHSDQEWQKLDFPITQQFIADFTGMARETASSAMHQLEKDKVIKRGKLRTLEVRQEALDSLG
jgi:CRP-like cAMP-binding protein